tara:strand:- start:189 stop:1328 length:1140 start_codon:yes stop_codon:yes gene_type:complete
MKILHLISSLDKGGAETHLATLSREQKKKNDVTIIYFKGNDYWKKKLEKQKIKVIRLHLSSNFVLFQLFELISKINKIIKKIKPDILHSHLTMMELVGAFLFKFATRNYKFIVTKHLDSFFLEGSNGQNRPFKGIFIDKFIISTSHKTICISKQVKNFFQKELENQKKKLTLIYYGFDYKNFKKNINFKKSKEYKLIRNKSKRNLKLCCVARHVKQKSLDFLIYGFSQYLKKNKNCILILVGSGPETQNLRVLSKKLKINDKIIWINFSENVRDILNYSDIFVLTSEYEGLGLVLLEAMAAGTPIIASNKSAIPEVIKNNHNGLLIKQNNHLDLIRKIELIRNKKNIKKFNFNSKKFLEKKFSLNSMIIKTEKVYNEKN